MLLEIYSCTLCGFEWTVEFEFYGDRPETDEEMNNRIQLEERKKKKSEKIKQSKLDRDKKEFERLKKKFG